MVPSDELPFWEQPQQVTRFAGRDPDLRLLSFLDSNSNLSSLRALDLGCAGGRNTVVLAERGVDFRALDSSAAMVDETRRRVAAILGEGPAHERIERGEMCDLSRYADAGFDLVVALGVLQCAQNGDEWNRSLAEVARVLRPAGRLLVAVFDPRTDMRGEGLHSVAGEEHVYEGFRDGRRGYLVSQDDLDLAMEGVGLEPEVPTRTVFVPLANGQRVTVNGLYSKAGSSSPTG